MKSAILILLILLLIGLVVFLSGYLHKRNVNMSLDQIKWKWGSFSDLKKTPVSVVVTNIQSDLDFTKVGYKDDFSEESVQIVDMLKSAKPVTPYREGYYSYPYSELHEQIWILFANGKGRVFPFEYDLRASFVQAGKKRRMKYGLSTVMDKIHLQNAYRRYPQEIHWNQIQWKQGSFSDLEKEVVGVKITDFEPDLKFDNVLYQWDFNDESLRIGYYLRTTPAAAIDPLLESMIKKQQIWLVFLDGTGCVFSYYDDQRGEYARQSHYRFHDASTFIQSGDAVKALDNINVAFAWNHASGPFRNRPYVDMWKVTWKEGTASDLEKLPYHAYMTDSDPNYHYETKKTKGRFDVCDWVEITELIKRADVVESYPDLQDRLRIIFEDSTGSVFPFLCDSEKKVCYVKIGEVVKCSAGLAKRVNPEQYFPRDEYVVHKPSTGWDTRIPRKEPNSLPK
jgi:hypothetical protein